MRIKIFFFLDVLLTSIFSVYMFFMRGEEAAILTGAAIFIALLPVCLWLSEALVISATKKILDARGMKVNNSDAISVLAEVNSVATPLNHFLTDGKFSVTDLVPEGMTQNELLAHAAAVEQYATHDLGRAIYKIALGRGIKIQKISAFSEIPCRGVEALIDKTPIRLGNPQWIQSQGVAVSSTLWVKVDKLAAEGKTPLLLSLGKIARGIIALKDTVNPDAKSFLSVLKRNDIETNLLTGTNRYSVQNLAPNFKLDVVRAELMPDEKAREVQILRAKKQIVAVLGDEKKDLPALYAADVSIFLKDEFAESEGKSEAVTDFEIPALEKFLTLREIALYAVKLIRTNRRISYLAMLILLPAALTMVLDESPLPFEFHPFMAGAGVLVAVVLIFVNSLRMGKLEPTKKAPHAGEAEDLYNRDDRI